MKLKAFKDLLRQDANASLGFVFSDGEPLPPEFHITEVGHVTKNFVDCGGTVRSIATCVLQAWVAANDSTHRLTAGKLAAILDLARAVVPTDDLDVEIEYEGCSLSQYPVVSGRVADGTLRFTLADKHTDCLAKEACGLESGAASGSGCCG
jgi:hypothetical protein